MPAPLARRFPDDVEPIEQLVESARRYIAEAKAEEHAARVPRELRGVQRVVLVARLRRVTVLARRPPNAPGQSARAPPRSALR